MRHSSVAAALLLGAFVAAAAAQMKPPPDPKAKAPAEGKPTATTFLSPGEEAEGKTLNEWAELLRKGDPSVRDVLAARRGVNHQTD